MRRYTVVFDLDKEEAKIKELEHTVIPRDVEYKITDLFVQVQNIIELNSHTHLAEDLRDSEKGRNTKVGSRPTLSSPPGENTTKSQKANSEVKE